MICILSTEADQSTNEVIDWIAYYNKPFIRINSENLISENKININISKNIIFLNGQKIEANNIQSVWYRKWRFPNNLINFIKNDNEYAKALEMEFNEISTFLFQYLKNSYWLNHPDDKKINKLYQMMVAESVGLNIPKSYLINNKNSLFDIYHYNRELVTKPLLANVTKINGDEIKCSYTRELDKELIESQNEYFFPSLIQEKIDKEFEIRSFYLEGNIYSMAIFSQNDTQTQTDFRHYNSHRPNRTIPYMLPKIIQKKIALLMNELKLICGSLDLIKNKNGNYVFLEVNPNGQFGMISKPCNYQLEKKIANFLIKADEKKSKY